MVKRVTTEIESQCDEGLKENDIRECYVCSMEIYWWSL